MSLFWKLGIVNFGALKYQKSQTCMQEFKRKFIQVVFVKTKFRCSSADSVGARGLPAWRPAVYEKIPRLADTMVCQMDPAKAQTEFLKTADAHRGRLVRDIKSQRLFYNALKKGAWVSDPAKITASHEIDGLWRWYVCFASREQLGVARWRPWP